MSNKYPDFVLQLLDNTLSEFPEVPTRTLAKRIFEKNKKFFRDVEQVRSALRRRRGAAGIKNTKDDTHFRDKQSAGYFPQIPPSQAKEWTPYQIEGPARVAIVSDLHVPYHNVEALEAWFEMAYDYEPSHIILNGDTLDFYRLSRFEKNPNNRDTAYELDSVHELLEWLKANFEADIIWKDGNHDERWKKYLYNHAPEFASLQKFQLHEILELDELDIAYVTDQRIIMLGELPIFHGHEMQGTSSINPARAMALKVRNSAIQSHCHRSSQYYERNVFGDFMKCYSTGCLCELTPEYARINRWNHGCAFVEIDVDNSFEVENVVIE